MAIRRASHAIFDTRYHIVWVPKYRKWILRGDLRDFVEHCFKMIPISNDFDIKEMPIAEDHVHHCLIKIIEHTYTLT
ncbi:MAG: IS200/IS605 family transposase [Candidatus Hodarchaeota archaeon]